MNLIFESDQYFRLNDYQISHSQLLIRGEKVDGENNIDLIFEGTQFINCPIHLQGIKIYELIEEEIIIRNIENKYNHRVFLIITESKEYYIKTGVLRIYKNSLSNGESSVDMTGNGQENLIWISR